MILAILAGNHGLVRFSPTISRFKLTARLNPARFVRFSAIR